MYVSLTYEVLEILSAPSTQIENFEEDLNMFRETKPSENKAAAQRLSGPPQRETVKSASDFHSESCHTLTYTLKAWWNTRHQQIC